MRKKALQILPETSSLICIDLKTQIRTTQKYTSGCFISTALANVLSQISGNLFLPTHKLNARPSEGDSMVPKEFV